MAVLNSALPLGPTHYRVWSPLCYCFQCGSAPFFGGDWISPIEDFKTTQGSFEGVGVTQFTLVSMLCFFLRSSARRSVLSGCGVGPEEQLPEPHFALIIGCHGAMAPPARRNISPIFVFFSDMLGGGVATPDTVWLSHLQGSIGKLKNAQWWWGVPPPP